MGVLFILRSYIVGRYMGDVYTLEVIYESKKVHKKFTERGSEKGLTFHYP